MKISEEEKKIDEEIQKLEEKSYGIKELIHGILIGSVLGFILAWIIL